MGIFVLSRAIFREVFNSRAVDVLLGDNSLKWNTNLDEHKNTYVTIFGKNQYKLSLVFTKTYPQHLHVWKFDQILENEHF